MTLDLDNMTQAEFDKQMAEIKEKSPNLFQFIADFVDRKVSTEEVDDFLKMERSDQVDYGAFLEMVEQGFSWILDLIESKDLLYKPKSGKKV